MKHSDYVQIKKFKYIAETERGHTCEFSLPKFQKDFIYITRKKNTISGNKFHTGKNPTTDPKTFILLSGEMEFSYRPISTSQKHTLTLSAPALIEVKPHTTHAIKALTDIIIIECNSISDIEQDNFQEEV